MKRLERNNKLKGICIYIKHPNQNLFMLLKFMKSKTKKNFDKPGYSSVSYDYVLVHTQICAWFATQQSQLFQE